MRRKSVRERQVREGNDDHVARLRHDLRQGDKAKGCWKSVSALGSVSATGAPTVAWTTAMSQNRNLQQQSKNTGDEQPILLDSGSDKHVCVPKFGRQQALSPGEVSMWDVSGRKSVNHGAKGVRMILVGGGHISQATFPITDAARMVLCAGKSVNSGSVRTQAGACARTITN